MKKTGQILLPLFVLGLGLILFGRFPSYPLRDEILHVTIKYQDFGGNVPVERTHRLNEHEIDELREACSPVWLSFVRVGSMGGTPRWYLEVTNSIGVSHIFYVDEDEFQGAKGPPKKLLKLLIDKYS